MTKTILTVAALATLLYAPPARAFAPPQAACNSARVTAWKNYVSCVDSVLARDGKGMVFDEYAAFAKCRHVYFTNWAVFQMSGPLAGSTCIGSRFTDNGDGTVTDALSALVWEKKTNDGTVHDEGNRYTWSTESPLAENGTAFTDFLGPLNSGAGFAGQNDWRLPTLAELQTIVLDFLCSRGTFRDRTCTCTVSPCIDATFGPTQADNYWCATGWVSDEWEAWHLTFDSAFQGLSTKNFAGYVRAVRGGL